MSEDIFSVHSFKIEYKTMTEPIYLIPFGDIHFGAHNHAREAFDSFCEWAREKIEGGKNIYFLGMGDYIDLCSFSERRNLRCASLHQTTLQTLDELYGKVTNDLINKISFMKGRCIGVLTGNHHTEFSSGITSDHKIAEALGAKYLGGSAFIKLSFSAASNNRTRNCIDIWAHHGRSAGGRISGSINSVEGMVEKAHCDLYLQAHDHKKWVAMRSILELSTNGHTPKLHHKKILLGRTGSFQKSYEEGPSYVASKMLSPSDIGVIKIELTPKQLRKVTRELDGKRTEEHITYIDIHASI